jgi:SAM-dependent methyltransferase
MESADIPEGRLYHDLAYLWPVMSPPEEYAAEANCWRGVLWDLLGPGRHHLLELGVGGGHNLSHLAPSYEVTAIDLSPEMLKLSTVLNPGVEHLVGDMRRIRLGRIFDAVLVHDAISCMTTARDLEAVFVAAAAHLESGGALIVAPEYYREDTLVPRIACHTSSRGSIELTYTEFTYDPDPSDTMLEILLSYYVWSDGRLRIEHDRMQVGCFPRSLWRRTLNSVGFDVREHAFRLKDSGLDYHLTVGLLR